jgi:hypothetical protein
MPVVAVAVAGLVAVAAVGELMAALVELGGP